MTDTIFKPAVTGAFKTTDGRITRRQYGRGHGYKIDGVKAVGVTTLKSAAVPIDALKYSSAEGVAQYVWDQCSNWLRGGMQGELPFLLTMMLEMGEQRFVKALRDIPFENWGKAATKGTQIHKYAEQLALGEEIDVTDECLGWVDGYLKFEEQHEPENRYIELVVCDIENKGIGTLDQLGHLPKLKTLVDEITKEPYCTHDYKCTSMIDIKAGEGVYSSTWWQLAGYGSMPHYIDANGELQPLPKIDHWFVLHVQDGFYRLIPFDIHIEHDKEVYLAMQKTALTNMNRLPKVMGDPLPYPKAD